MEKPHYEGHRQRSRERFLKNGWVAYRTRKDRPLAMGSDPYTHDKAGKYTIMVKVVDIFGNDTSQVFEVEGKGR